MKSDKITEKRWGRSILKVVFELSLSCLRVVLSLTCLVFDLSLTCLRVVFDLSSSCLELAAS